MTLIVTRISKMLVHTMSTCKYLGQNIGINIDNSKQFITHLLHITTYFIYDLVTNAGRIYIYNVIYNRNFNIPQTKSSYAHGNNM